MINTLNGRHTFVDFIEQGNDECSGLTGTVFGTCNQAFPLLDDRIRFFLDGSWDCVPVFGQSENQFFLELEFPEGFVFFRSNILSYSISYFGLLSEVEGDFVVLDLVV